MKKPVAIFIFILLCGCKRDVVPADILSPKQMEPLLWDLVRADQLLTLQYTRDTTGIRAAKSKEMYQQVLALHKVSEPHFKKSFAFYQSHPTQLKEVLDSMRQRSTDYVVPSVKAVQ